MRYTNPPSSGSGGAPAGHHASHEAGGSDAIVSLGAASVGALSGVQPGAAAHLTRRDYVDTLRGTVPSDFGFKAWSNPPDLAGNSSPPATGVLQLVKLALPVDGSVGTLSLFVVAAGATVANAYGGLYDAAGNLLSGSADVSSVLTSVGQKDIALGAAQARSAGVPMYGAFLIGTATTIPTFARAGSANQSNLGLTGAALRYATSGSALVALPSTITPSALAAQKEAWWMGLK